MGPHLAPSPIGPDGGDELGAGNEVEPGSVARVLLVDGNARLDVKRVGTAAVHGARGDAHVVVTRHGNAVAPALGVEGPVSRLDAPQGTYEPLARHALMKAKVDAGVRRGIEDVVALVLRIGHAKAAQRVAGRGMHLQAEVAATHVSRSGAVGREGCPARACLTPRYRPPTRRLADANGWILVIGHAAGRILAADWHEIPPDTSGYLCRLAPNGGHRLPARSRTAIAHRPVRRPPPSSTAIASWHCTLLL